MSGSGKDVSGVVRISRDEVGAGTFPDRGVVGGGMDVVVVCKLCDW